MKKKGVAFDAIILKFGDQGEKTGWRYIEIPAVIAQQLVPGNKKAFRVSGKIDHFKIDKVATPKVLAFKARQQKEKRRLIYCTVVRIILVLTNC